MFNYTPETQEKILISIISILGSGMISFVIGFYLGKRKIRYQEFIQASKEFRDAFAPALVDLDPINDVKERYTLDTFSFNIVVKYFDKHKLAVKVFSDYLTPRKRKKLNEAWLEYAYPHQKQFPNEFNEIAFDYKTINPAEEPKIREKIRNRINKIVSFGKY